MHHILYTPKTSVRTVSPSPRNCPYIYYIQSIIQGMPIKVRCTTDQKTAQRWGARVGHTRMHYYKINNTHRCCIKTTT